MDRQLVAPETQPKPSLDDCGLTTRSSNPDDGAAAVHRPIAREQDRAHRLASPSAKAATTASTVETYWIDIDRASFSVKPALVESLVESLVCTGRQLVGPGDGALRALTV
jgi:hypothetical protein